MTHNRPFFAPRSLAAAGPTGAEAGLPAPVIVLVVIAVIGGGLLADRFDSTRREGHIRSALAARGLAPAQVQRDWPRTYRCKHAYSWRTPTARGSACTDTFSGDVTLYGAER
jgi:hypothetical protein